MQDTELHRERTLELCRGCPPKYSAERRHYTHEETTQGRKDSPDNTEGSRASDYTGPGIGLGLMASQIATLGNNNFRRQSAPSGVPIFNQNLYMGLCPQRKTTWPGKQEVTSLTITSAPRGEFVLPVLTTLGPATHASQRATPLSWTRKVPTEVSPVASTCALQLLEPRDHS